jgi:hypothetical protein
LIVSSHIHAYILHNLCLHKILTVMLEQLRNNTIFLRDVQMGYRRLKEKVKEYNRRDAKLYGNMISKLSKLDSGEGNVSFHHPRLCATMHQWCVIIIV